MVEYLLTECHSDPNCTTENGETPLALSYDTDVIRLLLQHGAVVTDMYEYGEYLPNGSPRQAAQSTIAVFMVGDKGAGKSTLTKALMTEKEGRVRSWAAKLIKVGDVKEKTAGIECHTIHSSRIGSLTIYDLAGHREFHCSHDTVIRSSVSGSSSGIFLFVMDLGASMDDLKRAVTYWLSFIQSQVCNEVSTQAFKPYLLAVGSHAVSAKSKADLEEKQSIVRSLCKTAEKVHFVDYVTIDCRYSESPSLTQLRSHIRDTHDKLQHTTPEVTFIAHYFHVFLVSKCGSKPGMQLSHLMKTIESDPLSSKEKFLPQTLEALHEACSNINKRGVLLYIQTKSIESSWIIIDKDVLLREVNGSVFSPEGFTEHKELTRTGVVPFSKICNVFEELIKAKETDPQLIVDFLVHMEFCREIKEEDLLKLVTEAHTEYRSERHFLFPALTQPSPPNNLWQHDPNEYSSCWVLQCLDQHYLGPRFLQVLLLRLAFEHTDAVRNYRVAPTSPALHQRCTLWKNGIKWTTDSCDVLVEISDNKVVLLLSCKKEVDKKGKELELVNMRAEVIAETLNAKAEFCSSAKTIDMFVLEPQYPVDMKSDVSVEELAQAICKNKENVHTSLHALKSIRKFLFFEPYKFCNQQCLVDIYSKQLQSCKLAPQFIECIASTISRVDDFCTVLDDFCTVLNVPHHKVAVDSGSSDYHKAVRMFREWQSQSGGTYQCLRQHMDKYSVFSGRNILVCSYTPVLSISGFVWWSGVCDVCVIVCSGVCDVCVIVCSGVCDVCVIVCVVEFVMYV